MDHFSDRLSDYLDDEMELPARVELESHLARCAECTETLRALRLVKQRAAALTDREPAADLWRGIAAHARPTARVPGVAARRVFSLSSMQLLAASLTLVVISGAGGWLLSRRATPQPVGATAADTSTARTIPGGTSSVPASLASDRSLGVPAYDSAVTDLHRVLEAGRGRLKPETIRVLEENLAAIDRAIADARKALVADPESAPFLDNYVRQQMKRKLDLMKRAAALVSGATDD